VKTRNSGHRWEQSTPEISTAKAFYLVFRALPENERLAVVRYILEDEEVRRHGDLYDLPNDTTLEAFKEEPSNMPAFHSMEELKRDLLS
jgi:hypothetical protein